MQTFGVSREVQHVLTGQNPRREGGLREKTTTNKKEKGKERIFQKGGEARGFSPNPSNVPPSVAQIQKTEGGKHKAGEV